MFPKVVIRKHFIIRMVLFTCFGLLCMSVGAKNKQSDEYSESMVRAAVIFGILRFTEWPNTSEIKSVVHLCTLGKSPSSQAIRNLEKTPSIGQRTVLVSVDVDPKKLEQCDAIIVGRGASIPDKPKKPVLWICDECRQVNDKFYAIKLILKDKRIQFNVNLDNINEQSINLSSSLIELAAYCFSSDPNIRLCND